MLKLPSSFFELRRDKMAGQEAVDVDLSGRSVFAKAEASVFVLVKGRRTRGSLQIYVKIAPSSLPQVLILHVINT